MIYMNLFWSFFQIGALSFGGGMASIPLIQSQVVDMQEWLTLTEFTNLITIAEMTPGPIAINAATFVGIQVGGILGACIATLGCILPSCIIVFALAWFYNRYNNMTLLQGALQGLRPAVVALIASAGLTILSLALLGDNNPSLSLSSLDWIALILFLISLFILRRWRSINPIKIMIGSGLIGGFLYLVFDMI